MKRAIPLLLLLALLTGACVLPARAEGAAGTVEVRFHDEEAMRYGQRVTTDRVNVTLNGAPMAFDVPALTRTVDGVDSRTLVPVRPIAEALGAKVLWVGENRQVLISGGGDTIVLTLGSATAVVNGTRVELPGGVPAAVAECGGVERTMVPLRFVSEGLHATVDWDNDTYTARVTAAPPEEPVLPPADPEEPVLPPIDTMNVTPAPPEGSLLRVTYDDNAQSVTLYLNATPRYRVTDLGDRVAVDLLGFHIGNGEDGSLKPEDPVIARVRWAAHGVDLDGGEEYVTRVVVDLAPGCGYGENLTVAGDANLLAVVITAHPPETGAALPQAPERDWDPNAYTVCLDAGHGGTALGAVYEEVQEKDLTLPITLRVAELLEEAGCNVVLTRREDVYMDLYDRCGVANNVEADIFVSIHCNASETRLDFQGTFTYHYPKSVEGERLAGRIQAAVTAAAGSIDRGLLSNDYVVLRETAMPAALVETGFMSCHEELMRLVDPAYQERLAQGIAAGVEDYLSTLER